MKAKILIIFLLLTTMTGGIAFSQAIINEPPFLPMSPQVMAQGGSFVAVAHGYDSLFHNPAGFARDPGSLTLASMTGWVYARPDRVIETLEGLGELGGGSEEAALSGLLSFVDLITEQMTTGGIGVGASAGVGLVAGGFGLGASLVMDSYIYGRNLLGAEGDGTLTVAGIAGFAFPFELFGIEISVGGDVRPMVRVHVPITNKNIMDILGMALNPVEGEGGFDAVFNSIDALYGFGLAIDLGGIVQAGPFIGGISIRDFLGTKFEYNQSGLQEFIELMSAGGDLSQGNPAVGEYAIPMNISAGVAFNPDLGALKYLFNPTVHIGLEDPIGVFQEERSPWTLLHMGAEAKILLNIFRVRAGLNQGYITVGAGMKFLFLDASVAVFTRELGKHIGDKPNSGVSFEAALRF